MTKAIRPVLGRQAATFCPIALAGPATAEVGAGTRSPAAQGGPGG